MMRPQLARGDSGLEECPSTTRVYPPTSAYSHYLNQSKPPPTPHNPHPSRLTNLSSGITANLNTNKNPPNIKIPPATKLAPIATR